MPRLLKTEYKYKCCELACGFIIRGDKWLAHCKAQHGYKDAHGGEIKRRIMAVKRGGGAWQPFQPTPTDSQSKPSKVSHLILHIIY